MGLLQDFWNSPFSWIVPGKGVYDIGKGLMGGGGQAQPPDIGAPQYQMDLDWIKDWTEQSEKAIEQRTSDWLEKAMRGYRGQASGRGWTPATSGAYGKFGERASGQAAHAMAGAMADVYGRAAGMEQQAKMAGMGMYGRDYQTWLQQTQQGQQDWISSILQVAGLFL